MKTFIRVFLVFLCILAVYIGYDISTISYAINGVPLPLWRKIALYCVVELPFFAIVYLVLSKKIKI